VATLAEAVDRIVSELPRADTSITAIAQTALLQAIEHYSSERFWFNEARGSFTASNTILYPLSSLSVNWQEIDQMTVTVNNNVIDMNAAQHAEIQRMDVSGFTGYPTHWAIFAEAVRLYPKPASGTTYQVDVFGTKRLSSLTASTDTNEWLDEGLDLVTARASAVLCARRFRDIPAAQAFQAAEDQALQRMITRTIRLGSSGKLAGNW
jgi:hypothetical protein